MVYSQTKVEYEKRIDESEIPSALREKLYNCFDKKVKIKWFFQKDGQKEVFEAKFKYNEHFYSVEFNLMKVIQNVEIIITENELKKTTLEAIHTKISKEFKDFSILKMQREYRGNPEDLYNVIGLKRYSKKLDIFYDIELNVKQNRRRQKYEMILDENFNINLIRKVKLKSTDILDY